MDKKVKRVFELQTRPTKYGHHEMDGEKFTKHNVFLLLMPSCTKRRLFPFYADAHSTQDHLCFARQCIRHSLFLVLLRCRRLTRFQSAESVLCSWRDCAAMSASRCSARFSASFRLSASRCSLFKKSGATGRGTDGAAPTASAPAEEANGADAAVEAATLEPCSTAAPAGFCPTPALGPSLRLV